MIGHEFDRMLNMSNVNFLFNLGMQLIFLNINKLIFNSLKSTRLDLIDCQFSCVYNAFRCMLHNFAGNIEMYGFVDSVGSGPIDARLSANSTMASQIYWTHVPFLFMTNFHHHCISFYVSSSSWNFVPFRLVWGCQWKVLSRTPLSTISCLKWRSDGTELTWR